MYKVGQEIDIYLDGENGEITEQKTTYSDNEKVCGFVKINPQIKRKGIIIKCLSETLICAVSGFGIANIRIIK